MRDYKIPLTVAIPVAIGLLGLLWILRRKSGSGRGGEKRSAKSVPKQDEFESEKTNKMSQERVMRGTEKEGITISQRKIPETQARDRGSADLKSQSPELTAGVLDSTTNKIDNEVRQSLGRRDMRDLKSKMEHCGQGDGVSTTQRVEVKEPMTTAMGDGLHAAQMEVSQSSSSPQGDSGHRLIVSGDIDTQEDVKPAQGDLNKKTGFDLSMQPETTRKVQEMVGASVRSVNSRNDRNVCQQMISASASQGQELMTADTSTESVLLTCSSSINVVGINSSKAMDNNNSCTSHLKGQQIEIKSTPSILTSDSSSIVRSLSSENQVSCSQEVVSASSNPLVQQANIASTNMPEQLAEQCAVLSSSSTEMKDTVINSQNHVTNSSKKLPSQQYGSKSSAAPGSRMILTSTSSIDSISSLSAEEIESIWGLVSAPNRASVSSQDNETSVSQLTSHDTCANASAQSSDKDKVVCTSSNHVALLDGVEAPLQPTSGDLKEGSPSKSSSPVCDSNSEGSNDSGRGGSEHDTVCQGGETLVHFDFNMPSDLCGRFIGKQGKNINYLKSKTGANVSLTNNPFTAEYQICQVAGTQAEVDDALAMIRRKFPIQQFPLLTMIPLNMSPAASGQPDQPVVIPDVMQLSLPEGVSVEVYVSAIVDAGQVFVQQPTHRSFMSLEKLNYFLNVVYAQDLNVPCLPTPVECGVICVCENEGFWYRAMVTSLENENGESQVKFVDYGGYAQMPVSALKQIRTDFMSLPFQAVECFMANITPNQDEQFFSTEATVALSEMTQNKLLQCQVVARTENGIPYIHLYQVSPENNSAVMINRALVNNRLVRWIEIL